MSNFTALTRHPLSGLVTEAEWLDDYFGKHQYGVRFPMPGHPGVYEPVFDAELWGIRIVTTKVVDAPQE